MIVIIGNIASGKSLYASMFKKEGKTVHEMDEGLQPFNCDVYVTLNPKKVTQLEPAEVHHVRRLPTASLFGFKLPQQVRVNVYKRCDDLGIYTLASGRLYSLNKLIAAHKEACPSAAP